MKNTVLILLLFSFTITGCKGQSKTNPDKQSHESTPKTHIEVNREYDDDGNLIRFDSSYTFYYSNIGGDAQLEDSLLMEFRTHFGNKFPFSEHPYFYHLFFEDSLMQYDFYKETFFLERFKNNMEQMDRLFWEMDSLKNQFFWEQFPKPDSEIRK